MERQHEAGDRTAGEPSLPGRGGGGPAGQGGVQGRESGECHPDFQHQSRAPTEPRMNSAFTEKPFVNFLAASFSGKLMGDND